MATSRWSYWNGSQEIIINAPIENSEGVKITHRLYGVLVAGTETASPNKYANSLYAPALYPGPTTYPGTIYPGGE